MSGLLFQCVCVAMSVNARNLFLAAAARPPATAEARRGRSVPTALQATRAPRASEAG